MGTRKHFTSLCALIIAAPLLTSAATAKSFKAKYYKECFADVKSVAKLVKPKKNMGQTAQKASGLLGTVGSFAGLGGFGGSASKALNAAQKINKYSGIIDNVSAFSTQMTTEHPDPNDRFAAYGTHMSTDAQNLLKVQKAVTESQTCYNAAYDTLMADKEAGNIKKKKAKKRLKEIRKGSKATGDVLINAMEHIKKNLNSYNQALGSEQQALSSGLGGMASQFLGGASGSLAANLAMSAENRANINAAVAQRAYERATTVNGLGAMKVPGGLNAGLLSQLATIAPAAGGANTDIQPGIQNVAHASQEYIQIYHGLSAAVESQHQLEIKVNTK